MKISEVLSYIFKGVLVKKRGNKHNLRKHRGSFYICKLYESPKLLGSNSIIRNMRATMATLGPRMAISSKTDGLPNDPVLLGRGF